MNLKPHELIVKQNCFWKMVVRRMQDVRSVASIPPCAEEKKPLLFAYHAPTAFQIHFCFTIKPHELIISNNYQRRIQALSILQHPSKHVTHQPKARLA